MIASFFICFSLITPARAETVFTSENEVDVHYKKQIPLYLQHDLGDVSLTGWNQDLIRVKFKKSVTSDTEANAKIVFDQFDLISLETPNDIELRIGTPQGTDLLTKLRNRQQKKKIKVDLEIKAPATLALTLVLGATQKLKLSQWKGKVNITGSQNALDLAKMRMTEPLNVNCPDCSFSSSDSEFSGSILVSNQKIDIKKTSATPHAILISSQKGEVDLDGTDGDFQIRTQSGDVNSTKHLGTLQVQSDSGKIKIAALRGDLDIQTQTGTISIDADKIKKQIELKNRSGEIEINLDHEFTGEINLQSLNGEVSTNFSLQKDKKKMEMLYGPELKGRLFGSIGNKSGVSVNATSDSGKISLKQKELPQ